MTPLPGLKAGLRTEITGTHFAQPSLYLISSGLTMGISVTLSTLQAQTSTLPGAGTSASAEKGNDSFSLLFAALSAASTDTTAGQLLAETSSSEGKDAGESALDLELLGTSHADQKGQLLQDQEKGLLAPYLSSPSQTESSPLTSNGLGTIFANLRNGEKSKHVDDQESNDSEGSRDMLGFLATLPVQHEIEAAPAETPALPPGRGNSTDLADALSRSGKDVTANVAAAKPAEGKNAFGELLQANQQINSEGQMESISSTSAAGAFVHGTSTPPGEIDRTAAQQGSARIDTPVHGQKWGEALSERVVWMAKNDSHSAQITLNPPQLGPLQISLSIDGSQANASFASPHAEVRQMIEDAMPRLREMLADSGINLGGANVGAQLPQQQSQDARNFGTGTRFNGETAILPGDAADTAQQGTLPLQSGRGLVDLFA